DAIPLAPRPSLEQYRKLAKDLVKASRSREITTIREWAADWIDRLARQESLTVTADQHAGELPSHVGRKRSEREIADIVRDAERDQLLNDGAGIPLTRAQLFVARLHGFESWPRLVSHIEARQQADSPVSRFEAAADAIVSGDIATLERLIRAHPDLLR